MYFKHLWRALFIANLLDPCHFLELRSSNLYLIVIIIIDYNIVAGDYYAEYKRKTTRVSANKSTIFYHNQCAGIILSPLFIYR